MTLKLKYFEDFKWTSTILISVDKPSLQRFNETVNNLGINNNKTISLTSLPYVQSFEQTKLTLSISKNNTGLCKTGDGFV